MSTNLGAVQDAGQVRALLKVRTDRSSADEVRLSDFMIQHAYVSPRCASASVNIQMDFGFVGYFKAGSIMPQMR